MDLKDIKSVDQRSQKMVHGYLREIKEANVFQMEYIIPDLILHICALFYFDREYFSDVMHGYDLYPININFSEDSMKASLVDKCWGAAYGNIQIESTSKVTCKWEVQLLNHKLKMDGSSSCADITLGVTAEEPSKTDANPGAFTTQKSFTANGRSLHGPSQYKVSDKWTNKFESWKNKDIIGIELNLKHGSIEFYLNGKSIGVTHRNIPIDEDTKYRLMVIMGWDGQAALIKSHQYL